MSGVDPEITLHQDGPFCYRATMNYTSDTLDEMAHRVAERIEDELVQQILARLDYVKVVRCRDCKLFNDYHGKCHRTATIIDVDGNVYLTDEENGYLSMTDAMPDGYCAWGKRKEETE